MESSANVFKGAIDKAFTTQPNVKLNSDTMKDALKYKQAFTEEIDDEGNKIITNADGTRTLLGPDNKPMIAGGQEPTNTEQYKARVLADAMNDPHKAYEIYKWRVRIYR